jgi:hypothetical protein
VSSQKDTEKADLRAEIAEHSKGPEYVYKEKLELAQIYEDRGLSKALAWQVSCLGGVFIVFTTTVHW